MRFDKPLLSHGTGYRREQWRSVLKSDNSGHLHVVASYPDITRVFQCTRVKQGYTCCELQLAKQLDLRAGTR